MMSAIGPDKKKMIENVVKEVAGSLTRIAAERDFQKESLKKAEEETGVEKKLIRKMAKVYFKNEFGMVREENEVFEQSYLEVFGSNG
jgi:hypothetical protein